MGGIETIKLWVVYDIALLTLNMSWSSPLLVVEMVVIHRQKPGLAVVNHLGASWGEESMAGWETTWCSLIKEEKHNQLLHSVVQYMVPSYTFNIMEQVFHSSPCLLCLEQSRSWSKVSWADDSQAFWSLRHARQPGRDGSWIGPTSAPLAPWQHQQHARSPSLFQQWL